MCGCWNEGVERLGRSQHTGDARARVGARPDHEQALKFFAAVVRAKPGALQEDGLEPKGSALVGQVPGGEVIGRHAFGSDDACAKARQNRGLKVGLDSLAIRLSLDRPVDS